MRNKPPKQFLGQPRLWWLSLLITVWWGGWSVIMVTDHSVSRPPWPLMAGCMALSLLNAAGVWLFFRRPKRR